MTIMNNNNAESNDNTLNNSSELKKSLRKQRKRKYDPLVAFKKEYHICIEIFNHNNLMLEKEMISLSKQILRCYSINKSSIYPVDLYLSNYGCLTSYLNAGFRNWDIRFIDSEIKDFKNNIIYLSPDSDEILEKPEKNAIYVIGGLVDKNRYKGIVYNYCQKNNIKSVRLPIKENIKMIGSPILTINQVFEILKDFFVYEDWTQVLQKHIPKRKL